LSLIINFIIAGIKKKSANTATKIVIKVDSILMGSWPLISARCFYAKIGFAALVLYLGYLQTNKHQVT